MDKLIVWIVFMFIAGNLALANGQIELEDFIRKVRAQNLSLKVESAKVQVAESKAIGLNIPPPMLGINQMNRGSGLISNGFEVSQVIPFPTKLSHELSAREYAAKSQKESSLVGTNEVLFKAKILFFDLWFLQEKRGVLQERGKILESHIKLTKSSVRSDSFANVHLLKVESELDLLGNEILQYEQSVQEKLLEIAVFLNEDPAQFKMRVKVPPLSLLPDINSTSESPQVKTVQLNLESLKAKESEMKSTWFPDLSLRYKEIGLPGSGMNDKEIMLGFTLPFLFLWEPQSQVQASQGQRLRAEYELEIVKKNSEAERITLVSRAKSLRSQLVVLNEKLIPRAKKRMKIVHNIVPRDMESLQDHRATMDVFPDLKLEALELRIQYEQTVAKLERFLSKRGASND